ncbi:MAG: kelch repeat-containing protein [Solirubrobacteraceae bacterium]
MEVQTLVSGSRLVPSRRVVAGPDRNRRGPGDARTGAARPAWTRAAGLIAASAALWLATPPGALADSWAFGPLSAQPHPSGVSAELANGSVLVAGGDGTTTPQGDLLSASGNSFQYSGSMLQERIFAAATLLANGRVLIAGGDTALNGSAKPTAELWRPRNGGTFTATAPMKVARQVFTLTELPNGRALAVGGSPAFVSGAGSRTAELYSPAANRWTLTGSMPAGRLGHTATLLPDCRVLVVGDNQTAVTYNYVTGRFRAAGSEGSFQRSYHTATLLASGRVLIAGGETYSQKALNTASVYDPKTGRFRATANRMSTPHVQGFAARLADGRVIVGGGFNSLGKTQAVTDNVDIYNPATNRWSKAATLPSNSETVSAEVQTLHSGRVAVMGAGPVGNGSFLYTPGPVGQPVSPPARDCADLTTIRSAKVSSAWVLRLGVGVPGRGTLSAVATAPAPVSGQQSIAYGSARTTVPGGGAYRLSISPGRRARAALNSGHTLHVTVRVTFKPPSGASASTSTKVRVRGRSG